LDLFEEGRKNIKKEGKEGLDSVERKKEKREVKRKRSILFDEDGPFLENGCFRLKEKCRGKKRRTLNEGIPGYRKKDGSSG